MRIAQVAPLYESVPPRAYGGTERVVSYLTEELVAQGHDVTLFASADSVTNAKLRPMRDRSIRTDPRVVDPLAPHMAMIEEVARSADDFDVIHFHCDYVHFPVSRRQHYPHLTTLHGRLDIPELESLYREYSEAPVVSISESQRTPLPAANWIATVHHGLPTSLLDFQPGAGRYLAFLGRISPEKRADRAIEIARRAGWPLRIAAKIDRVDREYYREQIQPLLKGDVEYVGEIDCRAKNTFLGDAHALLFPIDWPEPFGLVMIEAMACGVPVIAWSCGSVPEVIEDGVNGFIVDNLADAVEAVHRVDELSREQCRKAFERRFGASRMAQGYVSAYESVIASNGNELNRHHSNIVHPQSGGRSSPQPTSVTSSVSASQKLTLSRLKA